MSDLKLFRIGKEAVVELPATSVAVEKSLQTLIERHLEAFLGVRLLASEYATGKVHGGRIDTLGIDENNCPVIIEYKRALNENVINQGLFYLNWLMDHKEAFELLVLKKFGNLEGGSIEWRQPRLVCIAGDFTKYDEHAIQQIPRSIELIRYRRYGDDLLLFELVNATTAVAEVEPPGKEGGASKLKSAEKTVTDRLAQASVQMQDRYAQLSAFLQALGDDVQVNTLKNYFAYKRIKNFACVEILPQAQRMLVYLKVDPESVSLEPGYARDVRNIGHFGTGDLEITINSDEDVERCKPLLIRSYESS